MTEGSSTAAAAGTLLGTSRRRRRVWGRLGRVGAPYALIAPVLVTIAVILGYPLYFLVRLSLQRYGLFELIRHAGVDVGLANYRSVLGDQIFWHTLIRTVLFTAANVGLTIVLGMLVALYGNQVIVLTTDWMALAFKDQCQILWHEMVHACQLLNADCGLEHALVTPIP